MLWSGRFEAQRSEAPDLQDDIAHGILSELEPELTRAEITLIRRQRPENVDAWGCYRQGIAAIALKGWSEEAVSEALGNFRRAIDIDADFGLAHANYALLVVLAKNTGLGSAFATLEAEAISAAEKAIALDDGSSQVLGYAGCALGDVGQHARGIEILERALELDPSNAQAHVALGATLALSRQLDEGIARMRHGMRISPKDRRLGFWGWALAGFLFRAGRTEDALQEVRLAIRRDPRLYLPRVLEAAVLLVLQRPGDARLALEAARKARPSLTLEQIATSHGRRIAISLAPLLQG
jgi:tetratricopeptide (TPR) repeat protein